MSLITEVLRTSDMQDTGQSKDGGDSGGRDKKPLTVFRDQANQVLNLLEYKSRKKYYQCLQQESESRREQFNKQNEVLFDYATELEREFTRVMDSIHSLKDKKQSMLTKLAGLLDK